MKNYKLTEKNTDNGLFKSLKVNSRMLNLHLEKSPLTKTMKKIIVSSHLTLRLPHHPKERLAKRQRVC
jgi:hypothetical protein